MSQPKHAFLSLHHEELFELLSKLRNDQEASDFTIIPNGVEYCALVWAIADKCEVNGMMSETSGRETPRAQEMELQPLDVDCDTRLWLRAFIDTVDYIYGSTRESSECGSRLAVTKARHEMGLDVKNSPDFAADLAMAGNSGPK
ncbi:hypothetical protein AC579_7714 [Pseudocercospora musae]|uniref:Uncharacterized protein n=1 Tax=Pseudocercospora musae TaxID=113226 RepID=A0A139ITV8_9PEZI|nr:hypothetical protein AC579_7714 [Pseudocercospora musae]